MQHRCDRHPLPSAAARRGDHSRLNVVEQDDRLARCSLLGQCESGFTTSSHCQPSTVGFLRPAHRASRPITAGQRRISLPLPLLAFQCQLPIAHVALPACAACLAFYCQPRTASYQCRLTLQAFHYPRPTTLMALSSSYYPPYQQAPTASVATARLALLASHCQLSTADLPLRPSTVSLALPTSHCRLCTAGCAPPASYQPATHYPPCNSPPLTAGFPLPTSNCQPCIADIALPACTARVVVPAPHYLPRDRPSRNSPLLTASFPLAASYTRLPLPAPHWPRITTLGLPASRYPP